MAAAGGGAKHNIAAAGGRATQREKAQVQGERKEMEKKKNTDKREWN